MSRGRIALVGLVLATSGCAARTTPEAGPAVSTSSTSAGPAVSTSSTSAGPAVSTSSTSGGATAALTLLDTLVVTARPRPDGSYDRDAFGPAWADVDGNGCNQRDDVLLRDAVPGSTTLARQGACDHDVLAGTWLDPYTGATLAMTNMKDPRQAQAVQIDHVVPLAEAWASGASAWTDERRLAFADDTTGLLAVDGPTNASKGDDDPAAWRPRAAYQCAYAERWVEVKAHWRLSVDASEVAALRDMLTAC